MSDTIEDINIDKEQVKAVLDVLIGQADHHAGTAAVLASFAFACVLHATQKNRGKAVQEMHYLFDQAWEAIKAHGNVLAAKAEKPT